MLLFFFKRTVRQSSLWNNKELNRYHSLNQIQDFLQGMLLQRPLYQVYETPIKGSKWEIIWIYVNIDVFRFNIY